MSHNKFMIFSLFVISFTIMNCAKHPTVRAPTQAVLNQFPLLPEEHTIAPLEAVTIPEPETAPTTSSYLRLTLGQPAPFNGFIFNDIGAAFLVTEHQALSQRYEAALLNQRERDFARLTLDTNSLRLQINTDRKTFKVLITSFDQRIQDLQEVVEEENSIFHDIWTIVGAGSAGIVVGFVVGYIMAL